MWTIDIQLGEIASIVVHIYSMRPYLQRVQCVHWAASALDVAEGGRAAAVTSMPRRYFATVLKLNIGCE